MASTAGGLARQQLRQYVGRGGIVATPSCSYSTVAAPRTTVAPQPHRKPVKAGSTSGLSSQRRFGTCTPKLSSWPAGAVGAVETDESPAAATATKGKGRALTSVPSPPRSKTIADLQALKHHPDGSVPIVCLTAYDFPTALSIRSADIDLCLIGDSLANVALGHTSTQPLSLEAMVHHCQAVKRGLDAPLFSTAALLDGVDLPRPPLVVADMPFGATFGSLDSGVAAVVRLIQESGVDGVKIEGSYETIPLIQRLTDHGIPVMGHLGLQPQRVGSTSGYRLQGRTAQQAKEMLDAALALERAGCFSLVLECIPTRVGEYISRKLSIPTIGIGAGSKTDGQILVMNDMIGDLTGAGHVLAQLAEVGSGNKGGAETARLPKMSELTPPAPKFVRNFSLPLGTSIGAMRVAAVQAYTEAVRERKFPDDDVEGYKIKTDEWKAFLQLVKE
ncbi:3-methyl-2-oxobutanoate hydroxymethyltransferase [Pseudozyma hubeiensis]|nr:3-methyl-2-oxobutanoate hydroxymethyltransferase [Pseudozyma hubeiensis]